MSKRTLDYPNNTFQSAFSTLSGSKVAGGEEDFSQAILYTQKMLVQLFYNIKTVLMDKKANSVINIESPTC